MIPVSQRRSTILPGGQVPGGIPACFLIILLKTYIQDAMHDVKGTWEIFALSWAAGAIAPVPGDR